ncbi:hypothetical protein BRD00_02315 [Halobacteriales archaeon QS_8_69_26]|nr:MAG: hypothetical protein BRD00_02315 [Halobacteriales archaeon QS_8_69_26]
MGRVTRIALGAVALLVGVVVLVALLWFLGIIGAPSAGVEDVGDWGNVSENRTEVKTTVWVDNPNPFGIRTGNLEADYTIALNGVPVAEGNKEGIAIRSGRQTKVLTTYLLNDRLPEWWVEYVKADETVEAEAEGTVRANVGPGASHDIEHEETMLEGERPIIDALSGAANGTEGEHPQGTPLYEVRDGWATWGEVNESTTVVRFHFRVHNPNAAPIPADPDGLTATVDMNGVTMLETQGREFALEDIDRDAVIPPGETREVVVRVAMDNEKADEWFTSHVRRGEVTDVEVNMALSFRGPTGESYEVPTVSYTCQLRTAILVDDQETDTNCGSGGGVAPAAEDPATGDDGSDGSVVDDVTGEDGGDATTTDDSPVDTPTGNVTDDVPRQEPRAGSVLPSALPAVAAAILALALAAVRRRRE